jgi:hypothetical protein
MKSEVGTEMSDLSSEPLWEILSQIRIELGTRDPVEIAKAAHERGIDFGAFELRILAEVTGGAGSGIIVLPEPVIDFISRYLSANGVSSLLDPWISTGLLLTRTADFLGVDRAVGLSPIQNMIELAEFVDEESICEWFAGHPLDWLLRSEEEFDAIVSAPPFGMQRRSISVSTPSGTVEITDHADHLLILLACMRLNEDGVGCFVVPDSFSMRSGQAQEQMERMGWSVSAVIALPPGTFGPVTSIEAALAVIERDSSESIFVGELTSDAQSSQTLLQNMRARDAGPQLALGALVDRAEFTDYPSLAAETQAEKLARRMGLRSVPVKSVVKEINLGKREGPGFEERPNAVYLPLIGRSESVSSLSDLSIKPQNYAQLVLDPEKVYADFLAGLLNQPIGHYVRESMSSGYISKISKRRLEQGTLYLPDLREQLRVSRADTQALTVQNEITELRELLWSQPQRVAEVEEELAARSIEDGLSSWEDTLPYPLASILRAYTAGGSGEVRGYERLLHFFEATAEFYATVMLSAYSTCSDEQLLREERRALVSALGGEDALAQAAFGDWVSIYSRLSKTTRRLLGSNKLRSLCTQMFRTSRVDLIERLCSKSIVTELQEANRIRNDWRGHGGVVGAEKAEELETELRDSLSKLQGAVGRQWASYLLIRPEAFTYSAGEYHCKVELVVGSRTAFDHTEVVTTEPMEDGELHLLAEDSSRPLRLLPLVRMASSPESAENACYFYSRQDGRKVRMISYHFTKEAEITNEFPDTIEALSLLRSEGDG